MTTFFGISFYEWIEYKVLLSLKLDPWLCKIIIHLFTVDRVIYKL